MQYSSILLALLSFFSLWLPVFGQLNSAPYDPSQFTQIGTITGMTLNPEPIVPGANRSLLRGGTITVDGLEIIVPDNTIATLPAAAVAWPELFVYGVAQLPGVQNWKASVFGNRVNDQHIAGLVYIAQDPVRSLQGFITSIDTTTGHFTVQGAFNPAGVGGLECVINDPLGVYAPVYKSNPLWSVDPVNPSVHATTGFPMCIQKEPNDPACPDKNRPIINGKPSTQFTFGNPATIGPNDPDPALMAPLVVGDYVTISGQKIGNLFEVNNLDANLGYYTAPGTKPSYVAVDEALFGITFPVTADPPETRAVAFHTDPTTPVQWYAQDVDPCTGEITERTIQLVQPQQTAPIGRVVYRLGTTRITPATRNVGFRSAAGTFKTKNNFTAGEYNQPIMDYVFPELTTFGANMLPLAFDIMPFLAQGSGPYVPGNVLANKIDDAPIIGQLNPWPGATAPTTTSCAPTSASATSSSTASATPPVLDNVSIISAVKVKTRGGAWQVTVLAQSDKPDALLKVAVTAVKPVAASPMSKNADGTFSLLILSKGLPSAVTVTSNLGGEAVVGV